MTDGPVSLDGHRSAAGKIATDIRRHALQDFGSRSPSAAPATGRTRDTAPGQPCGELVRGGCEGAVSDPPLRGDRGRPGRPAGEADRTSARRSRSPHRPRHGVRLMSTLPCDPPPRPERERSLAAAVPLLPCDLPQRGRRRAHPAATASAPGRGAKHSRSPHEPPRAADGPGATGTSRRGYLPPHSILLNQWLAPQRVLDPSSCSSANASGTTRSPLVRVERNSLLFSRVVAAGLFTSKLTSDPNPPLWA